jgi:hypothetical protein
MYASRHRRLTWIVGTFHIGASECYHQIRIGLMVTTMELVVKGNSKDIIYRRTLRNPRQGNCQIQQKRVSRCQPNTYLCPVSQAAQV